jgi:hypothetical protein
MGKPLWSNDHSGAGAEDAVTATHIERLER